MPSSSFLHRCSTIAAIEDSRCCDHRYGLFLAHLSLCIRYFLLPEHMEQRVLCQQGLPRSPQRFAAHLDLKVPSACMPLTPCNRRAAESSCPVSGVAHHQHGARALPETLAVGRTVCHKPLPRKRRHPFDMCGREKPLSRAPHGKSF